MSESKKELSRPELIKVVFGNRNRIDVWGAVLDYAIDPPEKFTGSDVYEKIRAKGEVIIPQNSVWREIQNLELLDMIERVSPKYPAIDYQRAESPGWEIASVAVQAVTAWFPE